MTSDQVTPAQLSAANNHGVNPSLSPRAAEAQLAEILIFRRSMWARVSDTIERAAAILVTVYVVTVAFNLFDAARVGTLTRNGALAHAFVLDALPALLPQLHSAAPAIGGAVAIAIAVAVTAPILYRLVRRREARRRLREHTDLLKWWSTAAEGVVLDSLTAPSTLHQWLQGELDIDAPRRLEQLRQVEAWANDDPLFASWVGAYLNQRNRWSSVALAVIAPMLSVILARLFLILAAH